MILLVAWLWQGLAITVAVWTILAGARTLNAASRHVVWWLTCLAVVILPLAHAAVAAIEPASLRALVADQPLLLLPTVPDWTVAAAVAAWVLFAAGGVFRIVRSVRAILLLKRAGQPLESAIAVRLPMWRTARAFGRRPQLRVWDGPDSACALGLGRPVILVSRSLVRRLTDNDLDAIVMHERAHLERYDDHWQLLQALVFTLAGWHPAVWFIGRCLHLEREAACDDHVINATSAAREYAHALLLAANAQLRAASWRGRLAVPGAVASPSLLRRRVRRLLDPLRDHCPRPALHVSVSTVAVLAALVAGSIRLPAVVAFVEWELDLPRVEPPLSSDSGATSLRPIAMARFGLAEHRVPGSTAAPQPGELPAVAATDPGVVENRESATAHGNIPSDSGAMLEVVTSAPLAGVGLPGPLPASPPASPSWDTIARSTTLAARGVARAGSATGDRARDAGLSIGRFFARAGKGITNRF